MSCHYVRLSSGQHGFHDASREDARKAAKEMGAVCSYDTYVKGGYFNRDSLFSISYYDKNDDEVCLYSVGMEAIQVFDPPRKVAKEYLRNMVL